MKVTVKPSKVSGKIMAPPSKSMAHRLLICAGLSEGESVIENVEESQDILATLDCLEVLGAEYTYNNNTVTIKGVSPERFNSAAILPCRECGSTLRFFIPICLIRDRVFSLNGSERLLGRPLDVYEKMCIERGLIFSNNGNCITVRGPLEPGDYTLAGNVSSQFISGLLFALPLLEGDSRLVITEKLESRPYIDLTISALAEFGVKVSWESDNIIVIPGSQKYKAHKTVVEGDYSNAAFLEAFNLIGGDVEVDGLDSESLQGDKVYMECYEKMKEGFATISLEACPDLGPVLFGMAGVLNGAHFTHVERLRIKESDRIESMKLELAKVGIDVIEKADGVDVIASKMKKPVEIIDGHNDHRIVMTMAVLLSITGGTIEGAQAVRKSFPDFFERIGSIGVEVEIDG